MSEQRERLLPRATDSARSSTWADRFPRLLLVALALFGFVLVGLGHMDPASALIFAGIAPGLSLYAWLDQSAWTGHWLPNGGLAMTLICGVSVLYFVGIYRTTGRSQGWRAYGPVAAMAVTTVLLIRYHLMLLM